MLSILPQAEAAPERAMTACPRCRAAVPLRDVEGRRGAHCPKCRLEVYALVLPRAVARPVAGVAPQPVLADEATCFVHADKVAERSCDACGRFVCAVCDLELEARHLCPTCFNEHMAAGKLQTLKSREVMYDAAAVWVGWGSWLMWPVAVLTLPVILYLTIRYWKAPRRSLLPRYPWRFGLALLGVAGPVLIYVALLLPVIRRAVR